MRLSGARPWNPAITATWPCPSRSISTSERMSVMRAAPCAESVEIGICQPSQERALMPMSCSTMARSPAVTCSPEETTASYSRASCRMAAERQSATSSFVVAGHGRHDDRDLIAGVSTSRRTWRATLRMRSMSATEVPPNFMTRRAMPLKVRGASPKGRPICRDGGSFGGGETADPRLFIGFRGKEQLRSNSSPPVSSRSSAPRPGISCRCGRSAGSRRTSPP